MGGVRSTSATQANGWRGRYRRPSPLPRFVYFVVRLKTPSQLAAGGFASNSWHDLM